MKKLFVGMALSIMVIVAATAGIVSVRADGGNPWEPQPPGYCFIYVDSNGQTYEVCPTPTPTPCDPNYGRFCPPLD